MQQNEENVTENTSTHRVYQAQYWGDISKSWCALPTKSGGTFCNTFKGAKSKLSRCKNTPTRVVSYELRSETVEFLSE